MTDPVPPGRGGGSDGSDPDLRDHPDGRRRCWWCGDDPQYIGYHDQEWGRPQRNERALFEKLCLEGFQAGLSWLTILRKREAFREVFAGFDPEVVAAYGDTEVERLLGDARIVRSRAKIVATITNARALVSLWDSGGRLSDLVWAHACGDPARPRPTGRSAVPVTTSASHALARALKGYGFRFIGPTSAYAYLQSMGLVDDHLAGCHVPEQVTGPYAPASGERDGPDDGRR